MQVLLTCNRQPPALIEVGGVPVGAWPTVSPDDWCGEWRPTGRRREGGDVNVVVHDQPGAPGIRGPGDLGPAAGAMAQAAAELRAQQSQHRVDI